MLAATYRLVTAPLRPPLHDADVTDAEAETAQRRLGALDDAVFDGVVHQMAALEEGKFLRRLLTETEEEVEAPESLRRFVERLAKVGEQRTVRAAVGGQRGHALGRLLAALGAVPKEAAVRFVRKAGGPDAVAAAATDAAVRAALQDHARATASLGRALSALLRTSPPAVEVLRTFARAYAARPRSFSGPWAQAVATALDRGARATEAEGPLYDRPPDGPPPFDTLTTVELIEHVRIRRPRPPAAIVAE